MAEIGHVDKVDPDKQIWPRPWAVQFLGSSAKYLRFHNNNDAQFHYNCSRLFVYFVVYMQVTKSLKYRCTFHQKQCCFVVGAPVQELILSAELAVQL